MGAIRGRFADNSTMRMNLAVLVILASGAVAAWGCGGDKPPPAPTATRAAPASEIASPTAGATGLPAIFGTATADGPTADAGRRLYIVGTDEFPQATLERLRTHFRDEYGLNFKVLPPVLLTDDDADASRLQLVAERFMDAVGRALPSRGTGDVVVGVTDYDMMIREKPDWRFAFADREVTRGIGVVSTTRMDPTSFGLPADDELLFHRLVKMVAKHVGVMYLHLSPSSDPRSVMYNNVLSVEDLDLMREELPR